MAAADPVVDTDPVSGVHARHAGADLDNDPGRFVADRPSDPVTQFVGRTVVIVQIAPADAGRLDADEGPPGLDGGSG